jgi:MarR family transcriptional regulator, transcriptional regulator for hemolysin
MAVRVEGTEDRIESPRCFSTNLGWLLKQASYALSTELMAALTPLGVSPRGYHVLVAALTGEHTQTELAQVVGLDKTTMVVTIDELETAGLAKRLPSTEDRRARLITVTKAGQRKVAEAEAIVDRVQAEVLGELPPRERRAFLEALAQLVAGGLAKPAPCAQPVRRR